MKESKKWDASQRDTGIHDIHSGWARKFEGEEMAVVEQATPEDFQQIFADYGYDLAISKDPESLSYVMEPKAGFPFWMIGPIYTAETKSTKSPKREGRVKEETYAWLDEYFALQQENLQTIQLVGHHPAEPYRQIRRRVYFGKCGRCNRLFCRKKASKRALQGHIHAQDISGGDGSGGSFL
ncbi:MAG: hypothetical protein IPF67_17530 [Saprospiraceae bacterium]|nr:hypothetical protein [Candidatus Brachybacter algidus]